MRECRCYFQSWRDFKSASFPPLVCTKDHMNATIPTVTGSPLERDASHKAKLLGLVAGPPLSFASGEVQEGAIRSKGSCRDNNPIHLNRRGISSEVIPASRTA